MPTGNGFTAQPGNNQTGPPKVDGQGPAVAVERDDELWGELPLRVRARFRNQGSDEVPSRYREWIDSYYRRLNAR